MPGSRSAAVALTVALVGGASPAGAQTAFLGAAVAQDVRRFSTTPGPPVLDTEAMALRVTGGAFLAARWTVTLEADWGGEATVVRTTTVQIRGQSFDLETSHRNRVRTVAAVTGVDLPAAARLRVRVVGGVAFSTVRREVVSEAPPLVLGDPSAPSRTEYVDRFVAPLVGVDAAIVLGRGVSIVPALRAQGLHLSEDLDGYSVRPSVGVNWTF